MTVLVFDGHYILHRNLHVDNVARLQTTDGVKTGGLYSVLKIATNLTQKFRPGRIVFTWDRGHSRRRENVMPLYKADRKLDLAVATPEEVADRQAYWELFNSAHQMCEAVFPAFGIKSLSLPSKEADDLCLLIRMLHHNDQVIIVSEDSDYFQFVNNNCSVYRPTSDVLVNAGNLIEFGFRNTYEVSLSKAICGGHDNLPNIPDVSGGTVATAYKLFGNPITSHNVGSFLDFCANTGNPARVQKLGAAKQQILLNLQIAYVPFEEFSLDEIQEVINCLDSGDLYHQTNATIILSKYEMQSFERSSRFWEPIFERLV